MRWDKEVVVEEMQSKHLAGVAVHVSIRETFPALVDTLPNCYLK